MATLEVMAEPALILVFFTVGAVSASDNPYLMNHAISASPYALVLPTQDVKAVGVAQAMLIDVRNGYPYGQVTSTADDRGASARFETSDAKADLSQKVADAAVAKLAGETEGMMRKLKLDLAALDARRAAN